jgi:hypothetical protein
MAAAAAAYLDVARGLGLGKAEALHYLEAYEDGPTRKPEPPAL